MKMITASLILLLLLSAGYAAPQMQNGTYAVVTVQMGAHSYDAIRWNRTTGEAYLLRSQAWQPIPEADIDTSLPEGTYEVQFISLLNDWGAIRINTQTGESWTMSDGQWIAIEEAVPAEPEDTQTDEDTRPADTPTP